MELESGVQVGGIPNGVAVEICRAGPSGCCHFSRQKNRTARKQTTTDRKEKVAF
jgi:hypothetical protein